MLSALTTTPRPAALKAPRTRICCRLPDLLPLALEAALRQRDAANSTAA